MTLLALLCSLAAAKSRRPAALNISSLAAPPASARACSSGLTGDFKYEACASFCSPAAAATHCKRCQCRACGLCAHPPPPPQSRTPASASASASAAAASGRFDHYCPKARCDPFCSKSYARFHCNDCKCKACDFCAAYKCVQPKCDEWCNAQFKKFHCGKCSCRSCKFCPKVETKNADGFLPKPKPPPPPPPGHVTAEAGEAQAKQLVADAEAKALAVREAADKEARRFKETAATEKARGAHTPSAIRSDQIGSVHAGLGMRRPQRGGLERRGDAA